MNRDQIQKKISELFKKSRIVFWYDKDGQFEDEVNNLNSNDFKIHYLTNSNWIYTKYLLECEDKENNYLIYAPFSKPDDKDNNLSDTVYYSKEFHADRISMIIDDLSIPYEFKNTLSKYPKFWESKERVNAFKDISIDKYSEKTIKIAILCSLSKISVANFDELLKVVLTEDLGENKYIETFKKMDIEDYFWELCKEKFSYDDKKPTINKLLTKLLLTYSSIDFEGDSPKAWERNILKNKNNVKVFISNLMNNSSPKNRDYTFRDKYDILSNEIGNKVRLESTLSRKPVETYYNCDTFEIFDKKITEHLSDVLTITQEYSLEITELTKSRRTTHFYNKFSNQYHVIKWANFLIKNVNNFSNETKPNNPNEIIDKYINEWFFIDKSYRKFYYYYDQIQDNDKFQDLRQLIENMYSNTFLSELAILWSNEFDGYETIKHMKQYEFYKKVLRHAYKKHKTVVIISDAFRFGVCDELKDELNKDPTRKTEISPMISVLPSNTKFGMAALLPHKKMELVNGNLLVDGISSEGIKNREKILKNYFTNSTAVKFDEIFKLKTNELIKRFKGFKLIYIYHDQIDARGDDFKTENEVFTASQEAIDEIKNLITKLTNAISFSNFIITADHGFYYKRDKINESDKVDIADNNILEKNRRYLISKDDLNIEGSISYPLTFLENQLILTSPQGMDIFKAPGSGQNYVHGGNSLQEMIIPLLKVKSKTGKKNQNSVDISLISPINRKITNLSSYLTFAQSENISNTISPVEAKIYFENSTGEKISNELIIHANKKDVSPQEMEFKEKITLRNISYLKSEDYYLVIEDIENGAEIKRYEFIIDIAFSDGFDF
jgi:uncharacterized protein (TIGR02687 family)